jgi:hypothetical protein
MLNKILKSSLTQFIALNISFIIFQGFIIGFFYQQMVPQIPLWYTKNWGLGMLSPKVNIILIPFISFLIILFSASLIKFSEKLHQYYFEKIVT